jgi:DNA-directed RNA polymerase subunit K/omega
MLYPSIQELLKLSSDEQGNERLNKYTLVMATAKCARVLTNQYVKEHREAEKQNIDKKDRRGKKEFREEKPVKNAVRDLINNEYEILFPGDEGYDSAVVDVRKLEDEIEEILKEKRERQDKASYKSEPTTIELMEATEHYEDQEGFEISDEPTELKFD